MHMEHFEICILKLVWWVIGIFGSLISSKTLMELIFNRCGEFRWSPEGPVSQIHSLHLHVGAPEIFSGVLRSVQMLNGEWGAESNGKLPHLFIPSKTATLVPALVLKDLPLCRLLVIWSWKLVLVYMGFRARLHRGSLASYKMIYDEYDGQWYPGMDGV